MNHKGTTALETNRLILRRFKAGDAEAMYRSWASDDEVTKYLTWPSHSSCTVTEEYLNMVIAGYADNDFYQWGIELKDSHELIGNIAVVRHDDALACIEFGWVIGRRWWGNGYTAEAATELLRFFFEEVGINRIAAKHDAVNKNSGRVMQKIGMTYEGTLRQADKNNRGIVDCSYYSILKSEYNQ